MRQDTLTVSPVVAADAAVHQSVSRDTLVDGSTNRQHETLATDSMAAGMVAAADLTPQALDSLAVQDDSAAVLPDSLPLFYRCGEQLDSLLARDSLLFRRTLSYGTQGVGMEAQLLPPALFRNDGVNVALISCFLLTLLFLAYSRQQLSKRVKAFFMPQTPATSASHYDGGTFELVHFLLGCQLSLICALLFYSYGCEHLSVSIINLSPLLLLSIYAGVIMAALVVKQRLYHFVHATFFDKVQRMRWYESFSLLFIFESLILFPLALLSVYFDLAPEKVSIILAAVLLFVKILLFLKAFNVFFGKIKGCLHLFLYFCALEVLPLLLTWGILVELTRLFTTIF